MATWRPEARYFCPMSPFGECRELTLVTLVSVVLMALSARGCDHLSKQQTGCPRRTIPQSLIHFQKDALDAVRYLWLSSPPLLLEIAPWGRGRHGALTQPRSPGRQPAEKGFFTGMIAFSTQGWDSPLSLTRHPC